MRVLVTAGPTREALDPVRFLSNRSSGRMGYAVAAALREAGHEVVLVSGPVALEPPAGVETVPVESAREMLEACRRRWDDCDALYAVAAVCDYRPARASAGKIKRREGEGRTLELVPNPDVLATLAADKGARLAVGFALESEDGEAHAREKLERKNLDFIALNGPEAQDAEEASLTLLDRGGGATALGPLPKAELARALVRETLAALAERQ